jgi:uncharacterized protein
MLLLFHQERNFFKMKNIIHISVCLSLLAFFWAGCGGGAATETSVTPALLAPNVELGEKVFAWRAVNADLPGKQIYLLGSVHAANADFYPLDEVIEDAYQASDVLVVELDTDKMSAQKTQELLQQKALLPPRVTLMDKLSAETLTKLSIALADFGIPEAMVVRFKPWFAAVTISMMRIVKMGFKPDFGIDAYFLKRREKPVVELETAEFQLSLFDEMSPELQELMLLDAIEGSLQTGGDLERLMAAWKAGDADQLRTVLFEELVKRPEFEPLFNKMFAQRNHSMAARILELAREHNTLFVVVGAGHMVGEEGLVEILSTKGYAVEQLRGRLDTKE